MQVNHTSVGARLWISLCSGVVAFSFPCFEIELNGQLIYSGRKILCYKLKIGKLLTMLWPNAHLGGSVWHLVDSLAPKPSHHPVFDRLLYAKIEGEGLGCIYDTSDINLNRQRSPNETAHFVLCWQRVATFSLCKHSELWHTDRNWIKRPQTSCFPLAPPSVYLGRHWCHFMS